MSGGRTFASGVQGQRRRGVWGTFVPHKLKHSVKLECEPTVLTFSCRKFRRAWTIFYVKMQLIFFRWFNMGLNYLTPHWVRQCEVNCTTLILFWTNVDHFEILQVNWNCKVTAWRPIWPHWAFLDQPINQYFCSNIRNQDFYNIH